MIKTLITNKLHTGRRITWANIWLDAGQSSLVDGSYPCASKAHKAAQLFDAELDSGAIEVTYVTDMPVMSVEDYRKYSVAVPEEVVEEDEEEATDETVVADDASTEKDETPEDEDEDVFTKGSIEDTMGKAVAVTGTGTEVIADGQTAKLAKSMGAEVAEVDAAPENSRNVGDPLRNAGSTAGKEQVITPAAQKLLDKKGISKAEATLIVGTGIEGIDGSVLVKDVREYLKSK